MVNIGDVIPPDGVWLQLFQDFIVRAQENEKAAQEFLLMTMRETHFREVLTLGIQGGDRTVKPYAAYRLVKLNPGLIRVMGGYYTSEAGNRSSGMFNFPGLEEAQLEAEDMTAEKLKGVKVVLVNSFSPVELGQQCYQALKDTYVNNPEWFDPGFCVIHIQR